MSDDLGFATGRVAKNLRVAITVTRSGINCRWTPGVPRRLKAKQLRAYAAIRDDALRMAAAKLGRPVVCIDV